MTTKQKRKPSSPERKALRRIVWLTNDSSQKGCFYQGWCSGPITCCLCQIRRVASRALNKKE